VVIGLHVTQYWTGTESPVCLCCKVLDRTDSLLARPCVLYLSDSQVAAS